MKYCIATFMLNNAAVELDVRDKFDELFVEIKLTKASSSTLNKSNKYHKINKSF